jgi:serine/threonine protein kinase
VAITDFGLSNSWSLGKILNTYCGSAEYAAPELFAKRNYGPEVPVY